VANWPTAGCAIDTYFKAQHLIFDITLCGGTPLPQSMPPCTTKALIDAAGNSAVFAQTCPGVCYTDYVVGNGSVYNNAYFDVASVRVYSVAGTNTIIKGSSALIFHASPWVLGAVALSSALVLQVIL
jgi:hypothetical protein